MAMGTRKQRQRQEELWYRRDLAEAPGHPFYRRLNEVLDEAGFDEFCEARCHKFSGTKALLAAAAVCAFPSPCPHSILNHFRRKVISGSWMWNAMLVIGMDPCRFGVRVSRGGVVLTNLALVRLSKASPWSLLGVRSSDQQSCIFCLFHLGAGSTHFVLSGLQCRTGRIRSSSTQWLPPRGY
jgi:hypothetical protein